MGLGQQIKGKYIPIFAYAYLCIPVLQFLLGWVRPILSIPIALAIVYSLIRVIQKTSPLQAGLFSNKRKLVIILAVLLIWVISSGIGGLVWQNRWDHMYRNAIFRDLVAYDWPVINLAGDAPRGLCYYIGFWLPSAAIGKLFGYQIGYLFQIVWALIGVVLAFLLICDYLGKVNYKTLLLFLFFSGLDVIPFLLYNIHAGNAGEILTRLLQGEHLELQLFQFNSSSNMTLLYWLYNQTIPFWIGFMLVLREKRSASLVFTYALLLLFAPFPTLAMLPLVIYRFFRLSPNIINRSGVHLRQFAREAITVENVTGLLTGLVVAAYYASNAATGKLQLIDMNSKMVVHLVLFLITEFLVYLVFVFSDAKRDMTWWILFGTMIALSFIKLGISYDFAWRTCIPAAFYLMLLVMRYANNITDQARWKKLLFLFVILLGCITPVTEVLRTTENTVNISLGKLDEPLICNNMQSVFDNTKDICYENFIGKQDSFFAKYLQAK